MSKVTRKGRRKAGLPPGSLIHTGERKAEKTKITVFDYDENGFTELAPKSIEECLPFKDTATVSWINIDGVHEVEIIEKICRHFGLHPLLIEDILDTDHRPKMEDQGDYIYVTLKMLCCDEKGKRATVEQVSIVTGHNFVLSFQEAPGDVFDAIRERIRSGKGRIRKLGADYLAYSLLDAVVDNYFIILESFGERIEKLEDRLVASPGQKILGEVHELKRELIFLRKSVWPLREVISGLERCESPIIRESTDAYFRDVYDHTIQIIDTIESFRDMTSGMLDIYLSSVSNRMNEIMKVLTIIATIFIPLTFIAGVYGMNFKFMPELGWRYGYLVIWGVMIAAAAAMLVYFKRRKWL
jgi:magnesium transporter